MELEVKEITKNFGSKRVLNDINMTVKSGEIHGLLGKNGAGKSTLVNIISGVISDYKGNIIIGGKNLDNLNVKERQNSGIYVVPQHAAIIPNLSIGENLFLGMLPENKGIVQLTKMYKKAKEILSEYGVSYDVETKIGKLPLLDQRKINIIRAIFSRASLIILDEPTTALSVADRNNLFNFVRDLSSKGTSFIFISHYMEEILELCDSVTVIRDGISFANYPIKDVNEDILTNMIVGDDVTLVERSRTHLSQLREKPLVKIKDMNGSGIHNINFEMEYGEVVGVVGLPDSGSREFCRTIGGMSPFKGDIKLAGKLIRNFKSPKEAIKNSVVYVSFDRHKEGIIPLRSIRENINLSILDKIKTKLGIIKSKQDVQNAEYYFSNLSVNALSTEEAVGKLSGGNQQKVIIAKALSVKPNLLILDEPTIGIDVKSREEILGVVNNLSKEEGLGVLYLTNDYNELLRICDRVLFFNDGEVIKDVKNENLTEEEVVRLRDNIIESGEAL